MTEYALKELTRKKPSPVHHRSVSDDIGSRVFVPSSSPSTRDDLHIGTRLDSIGERDETKDKNKDEVPKTEIAQAENRRLVQPHLFVDWKTGSTRQVVLGSRGLSYAKALELSGMYDVAENKSWILTELGTKFFIKYMNWGDYMDSVNLTAAWSTVLLQDQDKLSAFLTKFAKNREYSSTIVETSHIREILRNMHIKNAEMLNFGVLHDMPQLVGFVFSQKVKDNGQGNSTSPSKTHAWLLATTSASTLFEEKKMQEQKQKKSTMDSESDNEDGGNWDEMFSAVIFSKIKGKRSTITTLVISSTRNTAVDACIVKLLEMCQDVGRGVQAGVVYNAKDIDNDAKLKRLNALGRCHRSKDGSSDGNPRFWAHVGSSVLNAANW